MKQGALFDIPSVQKRTNKAWSYQNDPAGKDEWLTPQYILKALGPFDLDPCAPINRPWDMAEHHFTTQDNGLGKEWFGRVWCNPPYNKADVWLAKLSQYGNGIAMVFARTETKMFFEYVWGQADAIFFIKGRVTFLHLDGTKPSFTSGGPSCLVAYGLDNVISLRDSGLVGKLVVNGFG